jgi:hypothetical protein
VHLQFLFGLFAVVPAFLVWRHARNGRPVPWRGLALWVGLSALLILPLLPLLRSLSRFPDPSALVLPGPRTLMDILTPGTLAQALAVFALLLLLPGTRRAGLEGLRTPAARSALALGVFWFLAPPLLLFVLSHLMHKTVLIERYVLHIVAAQALIVAVLFRGFPRIPATLALVACFLLYPVLYGVMSASKDDGRLSWRQPLHAVRALDPTGAAPVFVQSGHPPTNAIDWQHAIEQRTFFYAHLAAYPLPNRTYPLPYRLDASVEDYVRRLADAELAGSEVVYIAGLAHHPTIEWVRQFFEQRGYTTSFGVKQALWLLVLRKPETGRPPS